MKISGAGGIYHAHISTKTILNASCLTLKLESDVKYQLLMFKCRYLKDNSLVPLENK